MSPDGQLALANMLPHEELLDFVENGAVALHWVGADGTILWANQAELDLLGYTREEYLGRPVSDFHADRDTIEDILRRLTANETLHNYQARLRCKDGSLRHVLITSNVRRENGEFMHTRCFTRDITELKEAEEALHLRHQELERLNERLRLAMAETHHRVKNNLQVVSGLIDLQIMRGMALIPCEQVERLGRHIRSLAAIHELLTREAKRDPALETLQARPVLEKLAEVLQSTITDREIRFDIEDMTLPIRQGTALAIIVNELVANALQHGQGQIEVSLHASDGAAQLVVCDNGPGVPDSFLSASTGRTGLEIVESVGRWDLAGEVEYGNVPSGGAKVTVTFPLTALQPA